MIVSETFDLNKYYSCINYPLVRDEQKGEYLPISDSWMGSKTLCSFDNVKLIRKIGSGYSAVVYEALYGQEGKRVAIKEFSHPIIEPVRVRNEECMLASLEHPSIPKFYCTISKEKRVALVLEIIDGMTVYQLLNTLPFQVLPEWYLVLKGCADFLHFLHRCGIIHKDLKPENIIIGKNKALYVIDFGLTESILLGPSSPTFALKASTSTITTGTPEYMAPEVILNNPYDGAVDWYGLGLTLYEMIMRNYPFSTSSVNFLQREIILGIQQSWLPHQQWPLTELIMGLMKVDPHRRWGYEDIVDWLRLFNNYLAN